MSARLTSLGRGRPRSTNRRKKVFRWKAPRRVLERYAHLVGSLENYPEGHPDRWGIVEEIKSLPGYPLEALRDIPNSHVEAIVQRSLHSLATPFRGLFDHSGRRVVH